MGLGQALLFLPSLSILGQHFRRRRALAIGIATSVTSAFSGLLYVYDEVIDSSGCLGWRSYMADYAEPT